MNPMIKKTSHKKQRFYQIFLPIIIFLILISAANTYLISLSIIGPLDLHIFGDISIIYLSILSIPLLLLDLAVIIASVVFFNRAGKWLQGKLPLLGNIFSRIKAGSENICRSSTKPFIFLNSVLSVVEKRNKDKG